MIKNLKIQHIFYSVSIIILIRKDKGAKKMPEIIYLDVLIAINLFVNYFLLLATKKLSHNETKKWRIVIASIVGSLFSLLIFIEINQIILFFLKVLLGLFLVFLCFGFKSKQIFFKTVGLFLATNLIFAGSMFGIWICFSPITMYYNNGIVYFDISSVIVFISTIVSYLIINIISFILNRVKSTTELYRILIENENKSVELIGFYDTGNTLRDSFSDLPVIIVEFEKIKHIIPKQLHSVFLGELEISSSIDINWKKKIRMIPYSVVGGNMMLVAFKPDNFYIINNAKQIKKNVLVGVNKTKLSDGEYSAILNKQLVGV